jgi:hypothetical protein
MRKFLGRDGPFCAIRNGPISALGALSTITNRSRQILEVSTIELRAFTVHKRVHEALKLVLARPYCRKINTFTDPKQRRPGRELFLL